MSHFFAEFPFSHNRIIRNQSEYQNGRQFTASNKNEAYSSHSPVSAVEQFFGGNLRAGFSARFCGLSPLKTIQRL
jgi:hypothetical protein